MNVQGDWKCATHDSSVWIQWKITWRRLRRPSFFLDSTDFLRSVTNLILIRFQRCLQKFNSKCYPHLTFKLDLGLKLTDSVKDSRVNEFVFSISPLKTLVFIQWHFGVTRIWIRVVLDLISTRVSSWNNVRNFEWNAKRNWNLKSEARKNEIKTRIRIQPAGFGCSRIFSFTDWVE